MVVALVSSLRGFVASWFRRFSASSSRRPTDSRRQKVSQSSSEDLLVDAATGAGFDIAGAGFDGLAGCG
jgi:hypothetical protein